MTAKVNDPMMKREQFATDLRKTLKKDKLSKKRYPQGQIQEKEPEILELLGQDDDDGFYDAQGTEARAVADYLDDD